MTTFVKGNKYLFFLHSSTRRLFINISVILQLTLNIILDKWMSHSKIRISEYLYEFWGGRGCAILTKLIILSNDTYYIFINNVFLNLRIWICGGWIAAYCRFLIHVGLLKGNIISKENLDFWKSISMKKMAGYGKIKNDNLLLQ